MVAFISEMKVMIGPFACHVSFLANLALFATQEFFIKAKNEWYSHVRVLKFYSLKAYVNANHALLSAYRFLSE